MLVGRGVARYPSQRISIERIALLDIGENPNYVTGFLQRFKCPYSHIEGKHELDIAVWQRFKEGETWRNKVHHYDYQVACTCGYSSPNNKNCQDAIKIFLKGV